MLVLNSKKNANMADNNVEIDVWRDYKEIKVKKEHFIRKKMKVVSVT